MKSSLKLKSEIGYGSVFYFDLDLKNNNETKILEIKTNNNSIVEDTIAIQTNNKYEDLKIMIVEDNKINMLLLKTILKNSFKSSKIFEFLNGKEAIEAFQNLKPDIVFMDIQMPLMNGYEATKAIRKLEFGTEIPIIAITAGTIKEEKDNCLKAGMNDYISKPIVNGAIEAIIFKWIN